MPNYCSNNLTVKHSDSLVILKISSAFEKGEFLQAIIPMPDELKGSISPSDTPNWYNWRVENWGVKWDVGSDGSLIEVSPTEIQLAFDSAWCPPLEAYRKMEELGFEINASYHEFGMCFYGTYAGGVDNYSEYTEFKQIPDWVVDQFCLEDYSEDDE